ncbi:STAS domain-containing protein [Magnetospirillum aberrantis]|uniref:STAS domain-containing protein n=1 Tax=Magnetospirillum aberrantis SpK TaxID=908842 RepID=A0A7C9UU93_9PROT|nr:STAS domain-containing protein [Magnetospirillum aberrantis SpK]
MKYEITDDETGPTLMLRDQLTFADREVFDNVIDKLLARQRRVVAVDLSALDYMDSAGLGMLLTLRDRAERVGADVVLRRPRSEVRELLVLACFDTLFKIEHG